MKNDDECSSERRRRTSVDEVESLRPPLHDTLPSTFVSAIRCNEREEKEKHAKHFVIESINNVGGKGCTTCINCGASQKKSKNFTYDNVVVGSGEIADTVLSVVNKLRHARQIRKNKDNQDEVDEIMHRVNTALKHCDNNSDNPTENVPEFDINSQKAKTKERTFVREAFQKSETLSRTRNEVIMEMEASLMDLDEELSFFCKKQIPFETTQTDEHFHRMNKALRKSADAVNRLAKLVNAGKRKKLRPNASHLTVQDNIEASDATDEKADLVKPIKKVFTEKELGDSKAVQRVFKYIFTVLEDGYKLLNIPGQLKNNFRLAMKQFKILEKVLGRKLELLKGMEDRLKKLTAEATNVKFLQEQKKKDGSKILKLNQEIAILQNDIDYLQENIQKMNAQLMSNNLTPLDVQLERRISIHITQDDDADADDKSENEDHKHRLPTPHFNIIQSQSKVINVLPPSQVPSTITRSYMKFNDQSPRKSEMSVSSFVRPMSTTGITASSYQHHRSSVSDEDQESSLVRESLEDGKIPHKSETSVTNSPDNQSRRPQQVSSQKTRDKTDKQDPAGYERHIRRLEKLLNVATKTSSEQSQELKLERQKNDDLSHAIQKLKLENNELKEQEKFDFNVEGMSRDQVLEKMQQSYQKEIHRLRQYIMSEQQRFQANLRKVKQEHDRYVSGLRNEKTQILRALVHFKNVVNGFIHKHDDEKNEISQEEGEKIIEEKVRNYLANEPEAKVPAPVLEILVSLESSLNKALLSERLIVKHANAFQQNAEKSLKMYRDRLQKTTDECKEQEELAKQALKENETIIKHHGELLQQNETLQREIAPSQQIFDKYNNLKQEVDRLTNEGQEQSKDMKTTLRTFEKDTNVLRQQLQMMQRKKNNLFMITINGEKKTSCFEKIILAQKAFETNRISAEKYEAVTQVLTETNNIVLQQFVQLVQRYVEYDRIETLKRNLMKVGTLYTGQIRFQKYLLRVQNRYAIVKSKWEIRKQELKAMKEKSFLIFTALLNLPLLESLEVVSLQGDKGNGQESKIKRGKYFPKLLPRKSVPVSALGSVIGSRLTTNTPRRSLWKMPPTVSNNVRIHTPKIVELDVNSWKRNIMMGGCRNHKVRLPPIATLFP